MLHAVLQIMSVVKSSADIQTHTLIFLYKQTVYKHNYSKNLEKNKHNLSITITLCFYHWL